MHWNTGIEEEKYWNIDTGIEPENFVQSHNVVVKRKWVTLWSGLRVDVRSVNPRRSSVFSAISRFSFDFQQVMFLSL